MGSIHSQNKKNTTVLMELSQPLQDSPEALSSFDQLDTYERQMASKRLKLWAYTLTALSGYVNVSAILRFSRGVSHHTGNSSQLAIDLISGHLSSELPAIILLYVTGAIISGLLFSDREFRPRRRYGLLLASMALIYLTFDLFLDETPVILLPIALLLGLQNAFFIHYRQALLRSTHVTGTLTDLGFALGCVLRGHHEESWKVWFYGRSYLSFVSGGCIAALIQTHAPGLLFRLPALFYFILGAYAYLFRQKFLHHWHH
ncbi:MAG: YoaK family protein [Eubacteriales bacterium]|nr:YoaK family protein [Eubacteriales bacterium]